MPVDPNWMYDFGDRTKAALDAAAAPDIDDEIAAAKTAASNLIGSGAYGSTSASYRIIVRADAVSPQGFSIEIRPTTA
jgi:hypothetical protein